MNTALLTCIFSQTNRYTTATRYMVDESEWSICECSVDDENPCGPDSHCLNRILLVECSPAKCPAKERCQNQCFVKRQYLDCEPFRSSRCGWGLKAKEGGLLYLKTHLLVTLENPQSHLWILLCLTPVDFTLSNARRFYSSTWKVLGRSRGNKLPSSFNMTCCRYISI